jgi:hypothetical protein
MSPVDSVSRITLDQLIEQLRRLREQYPDYGDRPVHLLDMEDGAGDNLVTHIEVDCFDEKQGPVTSLMSWPSGGR